MIDEVGCVDMYDMIDQILKGRGMSRRQLAITAGIPLSTISNMFARRTKAPSLGTLIKISDTLGVSLEAFVSLDEMKAVNINPIVNEEAAKRNSVLLYHFVRLNAAGQKRAIEILDDLRCVPKYKI